MACYILRIGVSARVNGWQCRVEAPSVVVGECPASVVISICRVLNLPFCPLALSLGRVMCLQQRTELCSREGVESVPGGALVCE